MYKCSLSGKVKLSRNMFLKTVVYQMSLKFHFSVKEYINKDTRFVSDTGKAYVFYKLQCSL